MIELSTRFGVAVLDGDGVWHSTSDSLQVLLRSGFNSIKYTPSPAAGESIFSGQARAAAEFLKAKITWPASDNTKELVY